MDFASYDLAAGEAIVLTDDLPAYAPASFHAQQAAEKALKALLLRHEIEFPRTHSIGELLQRAEPVAAGLLARLAGARTLTPFGVDARYPEDALLPEQAEARGHLALARQVFEAVRALLGSYLDAAPAAE